MPGTWLLCCFFTCEQDPNYGKCLGYVNVPVSGVDCDGAYNTVQRVCRCTAPSGVGAFGTGLSSAAILQVGCAATWQLSPPKLIDWCRTNSRSSLLSCSPDLSVS